MKKIINIVIVVGVVALCSRVYSQEPPPARVVVGKAVTEEISTNRSVTGVIYYERSSQLSTEVSGLVESVAVSQGDQVKKGDILVHLNTELLEKEISLTKTRIQQIDLRIQHAEKNYRRIERLYKSSVSSEKDYDDALYAYQDAVKEKQALKDSLARLLIQHGRAVIKAPFDGIIMDKNVDSGAWVQQGKDLMTIGSSNDLFVKAPIAEEMVRFIKEGESVQVLINAYNREVNGIIEGIDPVADLKTKNIFIKIRIPPMKMVAQNMSVSVFVPDSEKRQLTTLSRAAVVKFQGRDFVYVINESRASLRPVNVVAYLGNKVGVDNPDMVHGTPVVIEGNERLRPDQAVVVVDSLQNVVDIASTDGKAPYSSDNKSSELPDDKSADSQDDKNEDSKHNKDASTGEN
ncbi:Efflux transporter, RND family, MFP subunit (modular protein) [Desulfamplus magnetovallimortis]|uniref:Efflux transporter, RND family, MFP subunit (Modular protein) n=1 Tax=Desulfamplus magnetovallimortis TaxID=1246637 RepID=A0A1W1HGC8_9BACT|nr:efflux RND transporter periplasmic adaptor subunit [Desulfamplus magnetovallimortis]SLM31496.1 Efflux transporter, RND family, MFP subunit (modular protein) [Desulfamplus magnetovallimortis]